VTTTRDHTRQAWFLYDPERLAARSRISFKGLGFRDTLFLPKQCNGQMGDEREHDFQLGTRTFPQHETDDHRLTSVALRDGMGFQVRKGWRWGMPMRDTTFEDTSQHHYASFVIAGLRSRSTSPVRAHTARIGQA